MAVQLAHEGCTVVLWDVDLAAVQRVVGEVEAIGQLARAYKVDVANRALVYATAKDVLKEFGNVDILINNAGVVSGRSIIDADDARSELTIQVNTIALMWVTKAFLPSMIAQKRGHVVTMASGAGRIGARGLVDYAASKFGAIGFDEALRSELRHLAPELKTTCVCPGWFSSYARFPSPSPRTKATSTRACSRACG